MDETKIEDEVTLNHIRSISNILPHIKDVQAGASVIVVITDRLTDWLTLKRKDRQTAVL